MNYPFQLKFSAITNLSDARYAVCAWADYVGFCFDTNKPEYIEPKKAKEIAGWINGSVIVGEFGHQPIEWILDFIQEIPCGAIQIPANYTNSKILDTNMPIILEFEDGSDIETTIFNIENNANIKALICYTKEMANILVQKFNLPVLLQSKNYTDFKTLNTNIGIALKGEFETIPGTRNHDAWNSLLENVLEN